MEHWQIAHEVYKLRCEERRVRGLYTTPWDKLDVTLQRHWCNLVAKVVELYKPPAEPPKDDGL